MGFKSGRCYSDLSASSQSPKGGPGTSLYHLCLVSAPLYYEEISGLGKRKRICAQDELDGCRLFVEIRQINTGVSIAGYAIETPGDGEDQEFPEPALINHHVPLFFSPQKSLVGVHAGRDRDDSKHFEVLPGILAGWRD